MPHRPAASGLTGRRAQPQARGRPAAAMRLSKQQKKEATPANHGYPGDLWYAMARLHAAHPEPVGHRVRFERPSALLSITEPDDLVLAARVGLSGKEPMGHLHDLSNGEPTSSRSSLDPRTAAPPGSRLHHSTGRLRPYTWQRSSRAGRRVLSDRSPPFPGRLVFPSLSRRPPRGTRRTPLPAGPAERRSAGRRGPRWVP